MRVQPDSGCLISNSVRRMLRYLVIIWDSSCAQQCHAARRLAALLCEDSHEWKIQLDGSNTLVLTNKASSALDIHVLPDTSGVILGSVFARNREIEDETVSPRVSFTVSEAEAIEQSSGRWLVTECWGDYVAIIPQRNRKATFVVKDPTGNLPCFGTEVNGLTILFSNISDYIGTRFSHFSIDE